MNYQAGQIYVIQLEADLNSRIIVHIIAQQNQLYILPFNIPDQEPLHITTIKNYQPILLGHTKQDHKEIANFIETHYAQSNSQLWKRLQHLYRQQTLGKLFETCVN